MTIINPTTELVSSPATDTCGALWVSYGLRRFVNLSPCENDDRPLQLLLTLPQAMDDRAIADNIGDVATLNTRKATLSQLAREVRLAREGQTGTFKKGQRYILYLEASNKSLVTVRFYWRANLAKWILSCLYFGHFGKWHEGSEVYGN